MDNKNWTWVALVPSSKGPWHDTKTKLRSYGEGCNFISNIHNVFFSLHRNYSISNTHSKIYLINKELLKITGPSKSNCKQKEIPEARLASRQNWSNHLKLSDQWCHSSSKRAQIYFPYQKKSMKEEINCYKSIREKKKLKDLGLTISWDRS